MALSVIFLVLALICFGLGFARVPAAVNWTDGGFAFVVAAMIAGKVVIG